MICDKMGIDTDEVIAGMNTKWNALGFKPGLVGGHCIAVDPYYLTNAAEKLGYHSQIILNGRKVNDSMGAFVADAAIKQMIEAQDNKINDLKDKKSEIKMNIKNLQAGVKTDKETLRNLKKKRKDNPTTNTKKKQSSE